MNTYGDLVTLLLVFFVLLFSFSSMDKAKWRQLVETFTGTVPGVLIQPIESEFANSSIMDEIRANELLALSMRLNAGGESTGENATREEISDAFLKMYAQMRETVDNANLKLDDRQKLLLDMPEGGLIQLTVQDGMFFNPGKADILPEYKVRIEQICDVIIPNLVLIHSIYVVGHTDNVPINNYLYRDNWDLSFGRASAVGRYMCDYKDNGIPREMLTLIGRGEYAPVDPNADNNLSENRAKNRRVEILISSMTYEGVVNP